MKRQISIFLILLLFVSGSFLLLEKNAVGALIDFETVPGSSPSDKLVITNQYESLFGVTFSTSTGGGPYLEMVGGSDSSPGFMYQGSQDTTAPGYESQLGNYFLRLSDGSLLSKPNIPDLTISYSTPVSAASAQIWDIDGAPTQGFEQWVVSSFDINGNLIDSKTSPAGLDTSDPNALDGLPWQWSFDHGANFDIYSIEAAFSNLSGSKDHGIGLAFDNFSPTTAAHAPEPTTMLLFGTGLIGLAGWGRRKFKKSIN